MTVSSAPGGHFRVLKVGACPSLSGKSVLGYQIACTPDSDVRLRLVTNSGSGCFSQEWVRFADLLELLPPAAPLTFSTLQPLFEGRSVNTGGFLMAVLKGLGLLSVHEDNPRCHQLADLAPFVAEVQVLIDSPVSLGEHARPDTGKTRRKASGASPAK